MPLVKCREDGKVGSVDLALIFLVAEWHRYKRYNRAAKRGRFAERGI